MLKHSVRGYWTLMAWLLATTLGLAGCARSGGPAGGNAAVIAPEQSSKTASAATTLPSTQAATRPVAHADFHGKWSTTFGTMTLLQVGDEVVGNYAGGLVSGTIRGKVEGNTFKFKYTEPSVSGEGWFEMVADGATFAGKWHSQGAVGWSEWTGTRFGPTTVPAVMATPHAIADMVATTRPTTHPITQPATTPTTTPTTPATTQAAARPSFIGEWQTTFGKMILKQEGEFITGRYGIGNVAGTIKGKVEGLKFTFDYAEKIVTGQGWFELAADGAAFDGKWHPQGETAWGDWTGTRLSSPDSFSGLWQTSFGKMRLSQIGNKVTGIYDWNGGATIAGELDGRVLKFKYDQADGEKGEGSYTLAPSGAAFNGPWKSADGKTSGEWGGARIAPKEGITYLIVLEARWEKDIEEQEYSYGAMLRAFFTRVPTVQMRHRFIDDEASLRKYCAEVKYIAEPVVLYIASHGTKEGIACGGKLVPGKVLIDCMKDLGDIRLLHFGSCLVAGGDIPKQIREATGKRFPISGFVNAADWGGSAVVDFTYLDLVLERGVSPAMAVEQTKKMVSFAREKGAPDDVISGAGLVVEDGK